MSEYSVNDFVIRASAYINSSRAKDVATWETYLREFCKQPTISANICSLIIKHVCETGSRDKLQIAVVSSQVLKSLYRKGASNVSLPVEPLLDILSQLPTTFQESNQRSIQLQICHCISLFILQRVCGLVSSMPDANSLLWQRVIYESLEDIVNIMRSRRIQLQEILQFLECLPEVCTSSNIKLFITIKHPQKRFLVDKVIIHLIQSFGSYIFRFVFSLDNIGPSSLQAVNSFLNLASNFEPSNLSSSSAIVPELHGLYNEVKLHLLECWMSSAPWQQVLLGLDTSSSLHFSNEDPIGIQQKILLEHISAVEQLLNSGHLADSLSLATFVCQLSNRWNELSKKLFHSLNLFMGSAFLQNEPEELLSNIQLWFICASESYSSLLSIHSLPSCAEFISVWIGQVIQWIAIHPLKPILLRWSRDVCESMMPLLVSFIGLAAGESMELVQSVFMPFVSCAIQLSQLYFSLEEGEDLCEVVENTLEEANNYRSSLRDFLRDTAALQGGLADGLAKAVVSSIHEASINGGSLSALESWLHAWGSVLKYQIADISQPASVLYEMCELLSSPVVSMDRSLARTVAIPLADVLVALMRRKPDPSETDALARYDCVMTLGIEALGRSILFPELGIDVTLLREEGGLRSIYNYGTVTDLVSLCDGRLCPYRVKQDHIGAVALHRVVAELIGAIHTSQWLGERLNASVDVLIAGLVAATPSAQEISLPILHICLLKLALNSLKEIQVNGKRASMSWVSTGIVCKCACIMITATWSPPAVIDQTFGRDLASLSSSLSGGISPQCSHLLGGLLSAILCSLSGHSESQQIQQAQQQAHSSWVQDRLLAHGLLVSGSDRTFQYVAPLVISTQLPGTFLLAFFFELCSALFSSVSPLRRCSLASFGFDAVNALLEICNLRWEESCLLRALLMEIAPHGDARSLVRSALLLAEKSAAKGFSDALEGVDRVIIRARELSLEEYLQALERFSGFGKQAMVSDSRGARGAYSNSSSSPTPLDKGSLLFSLERQSQRGSQGSSSSFAKNSAGNQALLHLLAFWAAALSGEGAIVAGPSCLQWAMETISRAFDGSLAEGADSRKQAAALPDQLARAALETLSACFGPIQSSDNTAFPVTISEATKRRVLYGPLGNSELTRWLVEAGASSYKAALKALSVAARSGRLSSCVHEAISDLLLHASMVIGVDLVVEAIQTSFDHKNVATLRQAAKASDWAKFHACCRGLWK